MRAKEIMTRDVATVGLDATVSEIAALLIARNITALPVLDAKGFLAGIVSEGDLIRRREIGTAGHLPWWRQISGSDSVRAAAYVKANGNRASDVMTRQVVTVGPNATMGEIAALFGRHGIKRVPVVQDGVVIGIVSRADILRIVHEVLLRAEESPVLDDGSLHKAIVDSIRSANGVESQSIHVLIRDGAIELWGGVRSTIEKRAIELAVAASAPGRPVEDHLTVLSSQNVSSRI